MRHNHLTREIKVPGKCRACDLQHGAENALESRGTLTEAEQTPFWEHTDPSNSDASGQILIEHVEQILAQRLDRLATEQARLLRLTEHLVDRYGPIDLGDDCDLVSRDGGGCPETAVAVRWEHGFADAVCQRHAETAIERGAVVVYPKRHNGED